MIMMIRLTGLIITSVHLREFTIYAAWIWKLNFVVVWTVQQSDPVQKVGWNIRRY